MKELSVLIGGKAGDGINNAGAMVAQLLNHLGYRVYLYFDYPSLIRGGHNFAIIRGAENPVGTHENHIDFVLALNKETIDRHREKYSEDTVIIFNADQVKIPGNGVRVKEILSEEKAPDIMGNSAMIGAFAKAAGVEWQIVDRVFRAHMPKGIEPNLNVARRAYDRMETIRPIERCENQPLALLTGNEAIGLGMVNGGLETLRLVSDDTFIEHPPFPCGTERKIRDHGRAP